MLMTRPEGTIIDRLRAAQMALIDQAALYAGEPDPETWRELCRAKATIDALVARGAR
jgi:hypothetical protein